MVETEREAGALACIRVVGLCLPEKGEAGRTWCHWIEGANASLHRHAIRCDRRNGQLAQLEQGLQPLGKLCLVLQCLGEALREL